MDLYTSTNIANTSVGLFTPATSTHPNTVDVLPLGENISMVSPNEVLGDQVITDVPVHSVEQPVTTVTAQASSMDQFKLALAEVIKTLNATKPPAHY